MIEVEKISSKIAYILGFISLFVGFTFWKCLWDGAFYHLMAFGLLCYTFSFYNEAKNKVWKIITYIGLIACINNFTDEAAGEACTFNWSEYLCLIFSIIFLVNKRFIKSKINNFRRKLHR